MAAEQLWLVHSWRQPPFVPVSLSVLGLMLSIGLATSSITIMGSVEARKGGAWVTRGNEL